MLNAFHIILQSYEGNLYIFFSSGRASMEHIPPRFHSFRLSKTVKTHEDELKVKSGGKRKTVSVITFCAHIQTHLLI